MNRESDFVGTHLGGGYEGSREGPQQPRHEGAKVPHVLEKHESLGKALRSAYRPLMTMDAYTRHRLFIQNYAHYYGGAGMQDIINSQRNFKTDWDVLREEHQFLRDTSEDTEEGKAALSWEKKMAKKYYDKLFKEYAIVDLRFYKEGKCGMRWRTQQEVVVGKGQFTCGAKGCSESVGLQSYEVNFGYVEQNRKKNALVKVRLCPSCARKLFYKRMHAMEEARVASKPKNEKKSSKKKKKEKTQKKDRRSSKERKRTSPLGGSEGAAEGGGKRQKVEERHIQEEKEDTAGGASPPAEPTIEEEMDSYFADMFN